MKQIEMLKKDLEIQYGINIEEFLDAYQNNVKLKDMLIHFDTTPWVMKTLAAALNLRMARKYRSGDLNMLLLRDSDEADTVLMQKLSAQDGALEQLSTDHVNQHAELLRSRDRVNFLKRGLREAARTETIFEFIDDAVKAVQPMKAPRVKPRVATNNIEGTTRFMVLSDLHCEEVVEPKQVPSGEYTWDIMTERLHRVFYKAVHEADLKDNLHVYLLGDVINGFIHGNAENASKHPIVAITELAELIAGHLASATDVYDDISLYTVTGNHDRLGEAPGVLNKSHDFSYLLYKLIEAHLANYTGIHIEISESGLLVAPVGKDKDIFVGLGHGDQISGGRGEASDLKAIEFYRATYGVDITHMVQGHFPVPKVSSLTSRGYCITNGSLIGPGSYSHVKGFIPTKWSQFIGVWGADGSLETISPISA